jgi:translation initiation factor IF-3
LRKAKKRTNNTKPFQQQNKHRINGKIKADLVRVIDESGEQIGIKSLQEALVLAETEKLDLVEISPTASPPVCKIIDYGKFKYRLQKKEAEAKKNQTDNSVKELKVGYCTDKGDLDTKIRHARKFLANGNKVKFSMRFKGREKAFANLGQEKLKNIVEELADISSIDELSPLNRSQMHIILTPN